MKIIKSLLWHWSRKTLRIYLIGWYALWSVCSLLLFNSYLYFTLQHSLIQQLDNSLKITASEAVVLVIKEEQQLKFKHPLQNDNENINQHLVDANIIFLLLDNHRNINDSLGRNKLNIPLINLKEGYQNIRNKNQVWRTYTKQITINDLTGWLLIAESFDIIKQATTHLLKVILLSFPLTLIIVTLGGLFLADRALSPIDNIIKTTETISADNFTKRISYQGKFIEISKLSSKIDEMLDRLQESFNNQKRFTADVSHELRTPLTIMKGKIEVTLNRPRSIIDYQKNLKDLETEVNRLIRLVNDLLFLSQLEEEENEHYLIKSAINLSSLLEVLCEQIQLLAEDKQIEFYRQIQEKLMMFGNPDYLTRLFLNLLDNALKYTDKGGKLKIITRQESDYYIISITNTGIGIETEHLPYLFQRFYRTETARSRETGGTGLGLAIAQEIALLHGGFIRVKSKLNKETTFMVYLSSHPIT
jgi:heavy metal sensor kinase